MPTSYIYIFKRITRIHCTGQFAGKGQCHSFPVYIEKRNKLCEAEYLIMKKSITMSKVCYRFGAEGGIEESVKNSMPEE